MAVKLIGDWAKAGHIVDSMAARFKSAADRAILREGHLLRGKMVQNISGGGAPAGAPFAPHSPTTLVIRKFQGFGGSKILMVTGSLRNSITVKRIGDAVFVGILRKSGKGANVAEIHEFGATAKQTMTAKQRRFLMAAFRSAGKLDPQTGGSGVLSIKIPARPFIGPVADAFAKPGDVRKRFWDFVSKAMGYDLGKPG